MHPVTRHSKRASSHRIQYYRQGFVRYTRLIGSVCAVVVVGSLIIHYSQAATGVASLEAESGTATCMTPVTDGTASAGQAVRFSATACTTGADPLASLARIPWEGGANFYKQFPKANAAGWSDPSFFPVSVFLGKPSHAAAYKALGVNTYMAAEHDGSAISSMTNAGMFVLPQQDEWTQSEVGADPKAVGWFISDECDMGLGGCGGGDQYSGLKTQQGYVAKVKAYNDGRFTQANYGNGILRTFWSPDVMPQLVQAVDISSADKYTYTSPHIWGIVPDSPNWPTGAKVATAASYGWQADQMRSFQDPNKLRPIWTFVETARPYLEEAGSQTIKPEQTEGAVWSAIIHEARGVAFFQHNNDSSCGTYSLLECGVGIQNMVKALTAQIREMAPILNSQSYRYDFASKTDTMLKTYNGSAYIFAGIGLNQTTGSKTFKLPVGVTGATITVVGENRTLPVVNGSFTDTFANEYTHHIYRVSL